MMAVPPPMGAPVIERTTGELAQEQNERFKIFDSIAESTVMVNRDFPKR